MAVQDDFAEDLRDMELAEYEKRFPPGWLAEEAQHAREWLAMIATAGAMVPERSPDADV